MYCVTRLYVTAACRVLLSNDFLFLRLLNNVETHFILMFLFDFPDDFNRVILSVKRGQEFTDYINASFIDVSIFLDNGVMDI